jgi:hypothetical protein
MMQPITTTTGRVLLFVLLGLATSFLPLGLAFISQCNYYHHNNKRLETSTSSSTHHHRLFIASTPKRTSSDIDVDNNIEGIITNKLQRVTSEYKTHMDTLLRTNQNEIELCIKTEKCLLKSNNSSSGSKKQQQQQQQQKQQPKPLLLSDRYREKRRYMEQCLTTNYQIVQRLLLGGVTSGKSVLQNIQFARGKIVNDDDDNVLMLGNGGVVSTSSTNDDNSKMKETEGYDTALQVIHHTARDWTIGSASCRDATNGWIVNAIIENTISNSSSSSDRSNAALRILVPGAGLGRLGKQNLIFGNGHSTPLTP